MSSCYTTVTASVVQIAAVGALGNMLQQLKSREVDIFASSYFTTRPFAHGYERDSHEEPIYPNKKNASIKGKFEISRAFDLVHQLYVVIDLPGIANVKTDTAVTPAADADMPYYTNGVGAALINEVHISMGGHSIACLTGVLIFLYEELAGTPGKRADALLGKASTVRELKMQSTRARRLYVPMYFFFCSTRGSLSNALNIIGAQFQRVHLDMVLNSLASVIENGAPNLKSISNAGNGVTKTVIIDPISLEPMLSPVRQTGGDVSFDANAEELRSATNCARVTVDTHGITLAEEDRASFSSVSNMTLMDEVHILNRTDTNALTANDQIDITQFAKNLVFEILVAARVTQDGGKNTGPLRFDGVSDTVTGEVYGPLGSIDVTISGQQRFPANVEAEIYNQTMPFLHHSLLPEHSGVYAIPFSFFPEDSSVPDSHANVSKLDSLVVTLKRPNYPAGQNPTTEAHVFALSYNLLVQQRGMKAKFFV